MILLYIVDKPRALALAFYAVICEIAVDLGPILILCPSFSAAIARIDGVLLREDELSALFKEPVNFL